MEEHLRKLSDAGELSGLPGEGRRFVRAELEGDDASWAAFRLMKNNNVIPAWSEERIEIDAELDRLRARCWGQQAWLAARERAHRSLQRDGAVYTPRAAARQRRRAARFGAASGSRSRGRRQAGGATALRLRKLSYA